MLKLESCIKMMERFSFFPLLAFWRLSLHYFFMNLIFFEILVMPQLSHEEKRAAVELKKVGLSNNQIAKQLDFNRRTIKNCS